MIAKFSRDESVLEEESVNRGCLLGGGFHSGDSQAQAAEAKQLSKGTDLGSCQAWSVYYKVFPGRWQNNLP